MHLKVLNKDQIDLLPTIAKFKREYYLVGDTAIALQIGHRESICFDLFKLKSLRKSEIYKKIEQDKLKIIHGFEDYNQLNLVVNNVKLTFFQFPYQIETTKEIKGIIKMPDLLTLAAMKAFALGRRAKWKDYVDLYFLLKNHYTVNEISEKAKQLFDVEFNEKLFKMQLSFFKGISYQEEVVYIIPNPPTDQDIKDFLNDVSLEGLVE
jgi:hypothetical protein